MSVLNTAPSPPSPQHSTHLQLFQPHPHPACISYSSSPHSSETSILGPSTTWARPPGHEMYSESPSQHHAHISRHKQPLDSQNTPSNYPTCRLVRTTAQPPPPSALAAHLDFVKSRSSLTSQTPHAWTNHRHRATLTRLIHPRPWITCSPGPLSAPTTNCQKILTAGQPWTTQRL